MVSAASSQCNRNSTSIAEAQGVLIGLVVAEAMNGAAVNFRDSPKRRRAPPRSL